MPENDAPNISVDKIGKSGSSDNNTQSSDSHQPLTSLHQSSLDKGKVKTTSIQPPHRFGSTHSSGSSEKGKGK